MFKGGEEAGGAGPVETGRRARPSCPVPARRHGAVMRDGGGSPGQASPHHTERGESFPAALSRQGGTQDTLAYPPDWALSVGLLTELSEPWQASALALPPPLSVTG